MHHSVHCSTIRNSQDAESTQGPTDGRMGEQDVAYTDDGMSLSKKKGILSFETTWVGLEGITLSEISQRKTNTLISLTQRICKTSEQKPIK